MWDKEKEKYAKFLNAWSSGIMTGKEYEWTMTSSFIGEAPKDKYGFLHTKVIELCGILTETFTKKDEPRPREWKIFLGKKVAEIHHASHTWCFCDMDSMLKMINESTWPTYLGNLSPAADNCKLYQDNTLFSDEVVVAGESPNGTIRKAKLTIEGI